MFFQAGVTGAAMSGVVASEGGHRSHTSIPVLHAGSHFRHGLLQLMIHTIDPLHDGKCFVIFHSFNFQYSNFPINYSNNNQNKLFTQNIKSINSINIMGTLILTNVIIDVSYYWLPLSCFLRCNDVCKDVRDVCHII